MIIEFIVISRVEREYIFLSWDNVIWIIFFINKTINKAAECGG